MKITYRNPPLGYEIYADDPAEVIRAAKQLNDNFATKITSQLTTQLDQTTEPSTTNATNETPDHIHSPDSTHPESATAHVDKRKDGALKNQRWLTKDEQKLQLERNPVYHEQMNMISSALRGNTFSQPDGFYWTEIAGHALTLRTNYDILRDRLHELGHVYDVEKCTWSIRSQPTPAPVPLSPNAGMEDLVDTFVNQQADADSRELERLRRQVAEHENRVHCLERQHKHELERSAAKIADLTDALKHKQKWGDKCEARVKKLEADLLKVEGTVANYREEVVSLKRDNKELKIQLDARCDEVDNLRRDLQQKSVASELVDQNYKQIEEERNKYHLIVETLRVIAIKAGWTGEGETMVEAYTKWVQGLLDQVKVIELRDRKIAEMHTNLAQLRDNLSVATTIMESKNDTIRAQREHIETLLRAKN